MLYYFKRFTLLSIPLHDISYEIIHMFCFVKGSIIIMKVCVVYWIVLNIKFIEQHIWIYLFLGSIEAWRNLAAMYYCGDGVPKSEEMAKQIMKMLRELEGSKENWLLLLSMGVCYSSIYFIWQRINLTITSSLYAMIYQFILFVGDVFLIIVRLVV